jgi:lipoprotein signal peptidase
LHYGYVVDFINVGIGDLRWYVFNVADSSLVVGVVILSFCLLLRSKD